MSAPELAPEVVAELAAMAERWTEDAKLLEGMAAKCGAYRFVALEAAGSTGHYARRIANIGRLMGGPKVG